MPDWVAVSVGDGCTIAGIGKGLAEMQALGFIPRLPRHAGRAGGRARGRWWTRSRPGATSCPGPAETLADSICVGHPRNWRKALARGARVARARSWRCPTRRSWRRMREAGRRAGVFGEPAAAAALAGLRQAVADGHRRPARARALAVLTGSGLKDVRAALRAAGSRWTCHPTTPPSTTTCGSARSAERAMILKGRDRRHPRSAGRSTRTDLRIEGGRIGERGPRVAALPGEEILDLDGALVMPGLVNAHTHLYSALARGMPGPAEPPRSFVEILEKVWWRLDRALDEESVRLSALVGAIEAARSGTTVLFDHHASPSLHRAVARDAAPRASRRSACGRCSATRRRTATGWRAATRASPRTAPSCERPTRAHPRDDRCARELHALRREPRPPGRGACATGSSVHVHVAEDRSDVEDCRGAVRQRRRRAAPRHGLLGRARRCSSTASTSRPTSCGSAQARGRLDRRTARART